MAAQPSLTFEIGDLVSKTKLRIGHTPGRPLLLDLCCCAGGASMGYHRAGYNVLGVDINEQRNYPFEFVRGDALEFLGALVDRGMRLPDGRRVHAINASPPCQKFSAMSNCRPGLADDYPDLITPTRPLLQASGVPWVMENVPGAPLRDPLMLCGAMFGLELYRHRLFESNVRIPAPLHPTHTKPASKAAHWVPGTVMSVCGHVHPIAMAREVMEIDWTTREELSEAIPPAFTAYIGRHLLPVTDRYAA
jgi:DNA (cytosine-5)-methyltransferase 1